MTSNRLGQELGIGLEAANRVPDLHRLLSLSLHLRDDTSDTSEITPGLAIAQVLGDRRRDGGPVLPPATILLLGGPALSAGHILLVFEHLVEVVREIRPQMGLIVFDGEHGVGSPLAGLL